MDSFEVQLTENRCPIRHEREEDNLKAELPAS